MKSIRTAISAIRYSQYRTMKSFKPFPPSVLPPPAVLAKPKKKNGRTMSSVSKSKANNSVAASEKACALVEKSASLRNRLPQQLMSVLGTPPPLPTEAPPMNTLTKSSPCSSTWGVTSSPQFPSSSPPFTKPEEPIEETLRLIRNGCINYSSEQNALPVIASKKGNGRKRNVSPSSSMPISPRNGSFTRSGFARGSISFPVSAARPDPVCGGLSISPESEILTHRILHVQLAIFPSTFRNAAILPSPPSGNRFSSANSSTAPHSGPSPSGDSTVGVEMGKVGDNQDTSNGKKAWKVFLKKPRSTFPLLIASCRSDLMSLDVCVAAAVLTLLYNLLRAIPLDQQRKVVRLCIKLGIIRVCSTMLQTYGAGNPFGAMGGSNKGSGPTLSIVMARVCEVSALLIALGALYDGKVLLLARTHRILTALASAADTFGSVLEQRVTQHRSLSDFNCVLTNSKSNGKAARVSGESSTTCVPAKTLNPPLPISIAEEDTEAESSEKADSNFQEKKATLISIHSFLQNTEAALHCYLHVIFSLHIVCKSQSNVNEIGPGVVSTTAKVFNAISFLTTHLCPKLLYHVAFTDMNRLMNIAPHVETLAPGYHVPTFVMDGFRMFESAMLWSITLLERICTASPSAHQCLHEAHVHHTLRSIFKVLKHIRRALAATKPALTDGVRETFITALSGLEEKSSTIDSMPQSTPMSQLANTSMPSISSLSGSGAGGINDLPVYFSCLRDATLPEALLKAFGVILNGDREKGLADLKELGTLSQLTLNVLSISESRPSQCLQYYHLLSSIYGVGLLPAAPSVNPFLAEFGTNLRVPLRILQDVLKISLIHSTDFAEKTPEGGLENSDSSSSAQILDTRHSPDTCHPMLASLHPEWFSPELAGGHIESSTWLPPIDEVKSPWPFTDVPPPSTFLQHSVAVGLEEKPNLIDETPLQPTTPEVLQRTLQHHIRRLLLLSPEATDYTENPSQRHAHRISYEREDRRRQEGEKRSPISILCPPSPTNAEAEPYPPSPNHSSQLVFGSNFECGNLQRAIEISPDEFDLVLSFDTGTNSFVQWFCFSITGFTPGAEYRLNIINMEKNSSTFSNGQRPLMLHVPSGGFSDPPNALRPGTRSPRWVRVGSNICYFANSYRRPVREVAHKSCRETKSSGRKSVNSVKEKSRDGISPRRPHRSSTGRGSRPSKISIAAPPPPQTSSTLPSFLVSGNRYYTLSFTVRMPETGGGTVYLANCYPYSYSDLRLMLQNHMDKLKQSLIGKEYRSPFMIQNLCTSSAGLPIPLITATAMYNRVTQQPYSQEEIQRRPVCLLTARVHPGETNASWVMHGLLELLFSGNNPYCDSPSNDLQKEKSVPTTLLESFVFKIVPMLNVDGVMMGNHRCSIVGMDLNRDYVNPSAEMNPALFALKCVLSQITGNGQRHIIMGADFHGHSKAKNFLLYGCTRPGLISVFKLKGKITPDVFTDEATCQTCTSVAPEKLFPSILSLCCPAFDLTRSNFAIQKSKVNTNRVVLYREFGIRMCFGVEGTMMGGKAALLVPLQEFFNSCRTPTPAIPQDAERFGFPNTALGSDFSTSPSLIPMSGYQSLVETHYNQDTYCAFGFVFLWSLYALLMSEQDVMRVVESGKGSVDDEDESVLMRQAWSMLIQAGTGRDAPVCSIERTTWSPVLAPPQSSSSHHYPPCSVNSSNAAGPQPFRPFPVLLSLSLLTAAQRLEVLYRLLRSSQTTVRIEDCVIDEEDDEEDNEGVGEKADQGDNSDFDVADQELMLGLEDDDLSGDDTASLMD